MGFKAGGLIGVVAITLLLLGESGAWGLLAGLMFAIVEAHKKGKL